MCALISRLKPLSIIFIFIVALIATALIYFPILFISLILFYNGGFTENEIIKFVFSAPMLLTFTIIQCIAIISSVYLYIIRPKAITFEEIGFTSHSLLKNLLLGIFIGILLFSLLTIIEILLLKTGLFEKDYYVPVVRDSYEYILAIFAVSVFAPIGEEIFFRGVAVKGVMKYYASKGKSGEKISVIFSSIFFSISHMSIIGFIPLILVSIILAITIIKTNSIVPCISAHSTNNFILITLIYFGVCVY